MSSAKCAARSRTIDPVVNASKQSLTATPVVVGRTTGARLAGAIIRLFRPLLKVNLLAYRVEIANALFPDGPPDGEVPGPDPVRMLFIGDIAVSSYNVRNHGLGLASQTARYVAREHGIGCSWTTISDSELTMARAARALKSVDIDADVAIVAVGPPDVLLGTTSVEWSQSLESIIASVRRATKPDCLVVVAAIPTMHRFRAMPVFVQRILALQVQRLDRVSVAVASTHRRVIYCPFPSLAKPGVFIEDAFNWRTLHNLWGKQLGAAVARGLNSDANGK
ncbi:MAG: SGNH/GDSL hydrolase family protein [Rhodoglobus sp.]